MTAFDYIRASSVDNACTLLAEYGRQARLLAGGTDLLIEWRRQATPTAVIDISFIEDIKGIHVHEECVSVNPLTTHAELMASPILKMHAPLLILAASRIGSPQIRNRGTVGGNIMNAAACADTVPPLIALDAEVSFQSKSGERRMKLAEVFVKPYQTNAKPDEILTEIRFAKLPSTAKSTFIKLGRRNAVSISRLSVAAIVAQDESGIITDARIVPGATFPIWRRVTEAEEMLVGEKPSAELFRAAGNKVSEVMIAETGRRWSTEYKEPVIGVLVRRALEECIR